jgi:hypothetical protein
MKTILSWRALTAFALATTVTACAGDTMSPGPGGDVTLSVVNALAYGVGAQLKLDQAGVTLPSIGQASTLAVSTGSHRIQLLSSAGASLVDTNFSISAGSRHTVVLSGRGDNTAAVSIATDTISTGTGGSGYQSHAGSLLLVNSAPNVGPFDILISWGTDSVARLGGFAYGAGSLPPPAPYSYYLPFEPGQFTVKITNPGGTAALATTTFPLAVNDRWTVMLTTSIEGELILQATKQ